jgi:hypothetical protein
MGVGSVTFRSVVRQKIVAEFHVEAKLLTS